MDVAGHQAPSFSELEDWIRKRRSRRKRWFWGVCCLGGLFLLVASAAIVPCMAGARPTAQKNACINNLRMIDGAKEQWALENRKDPGALPSVVEIHGTKDHPGGYLKYPPECPAGGKYVIGAIGTDPTCSLAEKGHSMSTYSR